jgi:hypothetical protein
MKHFFDVFQTFGFDFPSMDLIHEAVQLVLEPQDLVGILTNLDTFFDFHFCRVFKNKSSKNFTEFRFLLF